MCAGLPETVCVRGLIFLINHKLIEGLILGLIQGLTEFLPISSSGHLVIAQRIFGISQPELFFDTSLHVATMVATLIFFRKDIIEIARSIPRRDSKGRRYIGYILLSLVPTGLIGLMVEQKFSHVYASLTFVRVALLITAVILIVPHYFWFGENGGVSFPRAFLVGVVQGIAVLPGLSRSGTTIMAAVISGVNYQEAFRFSFLISIPAISGATLLQVSRGAVHSTYTISALFAGCGAAFLSGYFSLFLLKEMVKKNRLHIFGYYLVALVLLSLVVIR